MENEIEEINSKITPEKAQKLLIEEGMDVTLDEAKEILSFLRKLANIIVFKYLENEKGSGLVHTSKYR